MSRAALRRAFEDGNGSQFLRATAPMNAVGVDRAANVLRGYVVAQAGQLKDRPGELDRLSLDQFVQLGNAATRGIRSHFTHGNICEDQLGTFLGRAYRFRLSNATDAAGRRVEAVRADLHFDRTALETSPKSGGKPLGLYVMDLAESDPDAISSSVVVKFKREYRLNSDGTKVKGPDGEDLPPLLRPQVLYGSDIVSQGAAVDGLLSFDGLRDSYVWQAEAVLTRLLAEGRLGSLSRREVKERLNGWLDRALDAHFGAEVTLSPLRLLELRQRQREREASIR